MVQEMEGRFMKERLLDYLTCPECGTNLNFEAFSRKESEIMIANAVSSAVIQAFREHDGIEMWRSQNVETETTETTNQETV